MPRSCGTTSAEKRVYTGSDDVDPRQIVADGYDRIAERYAEWSNEEVVDARA
jgi:hypothetical protein